MPFAIGGISSGDFKETSARVQLFHVVTRNSLGLLTPDAFTHGSSAQRVAAFRRGFDAGTLAACQATR